MMIVTTIVYMSNTLGARVLLARRDLDINQDELARRIGVSRPFISDIERGKTTNVGMETVFALADALGVRAAYLFGVSDVVVDEDDFSHLAEAPALYAVGLSEEEEEAVRLLRSMKEGDRAQAMGVLRRLGRTPQLVELDELLSALAEEMGVDRLSAVLGRLAASTGMVPDGEEEAV